MSHLGIWAVCENYDGDGDETNDSSLLSVLTISEDSATLTRTNYTNVSCEAGDEEYRYSNTAAITRSGNNYTTVLKTDTYVPLSAEDVTWTNTYSWCGITNWALNVPQSTLGRSCGDEVFYEGDVDNFIAVRNGNFLNIGELSYELAIGTDFTPAGLTLPNGTYAYSDGVSFAALAIVNSGNYSIYRYNLESKVYNVESGSYVSSNNVANFTVTGSTPVGCHSGSGSRRFTTGSLGLTMEFVESNLILFAQKTTFTETQFRNTFLGGGFSSGCF